MTATPMEIYKSSEINTDVIFYHTSSVCEWSLCDKLLIGLAIIICISYRSNRKWCHFLRTSIHLDMTIYGNWIQISLSTAV